MSWKYLHSFLFSVSLNDDGALIMSSFIVSFFNDIFCGDKICFCPTIFRGGQLPPAPPPVRGGMG